MADVHDNGSLPASTPATTVATTPMAHSADDHNLSQPENASNTSEDSPSTTVPSQGQAASRQKGQGPVQRRGLPATGSDGARDAYQAFTGFGVQEPATSTSSRALETLAKLNPFVERARPVSPPTPPTHTPDDNGREQKVWSLARIRKGIVTFGKFVGPGFMIAVAYSESPYSASPVGMHCTFSGERCLV